MPLRSVGMPIDAHRRERRLANVRLLRWALPAAAAVLVIVCAVQVGLGALNASSQQAEPVRVSKMLKPHFSGTNPDGRAFSITGREGVRDDKDRGRIVIADPILTLKTESGATRRATAKTGVYDEARHSLVLTGDVKMDNGAGTQFASQEALVDTKTGAVSGQTGLRIDRAGGQVESGDYQVEDKGDRLILKGGVRGRLTPER